ncbi:hypothetical protein [Streptomyces gobitricini]|uniref:Uncharacterized protein n=1 Tax=Streptomyces gobitricini TaxID=68211 RepID=A0ABN3MAB0_9ACTN
MDDDKRLEGPGEGGPGVPRDLPDEQAGGAPDHWDPDMAEAVGTDDREQIPAEDTPEDGAPEDGAPEEPTG